jgi:hypothetical protein
VGVVGMLLLQHPTLASPPTDGYNSTSSHDQTYDVWDGFAIDGVGGLHAVTLNGVYVPSCDPRHPFPSLTPSHHSPSLSIAFSPARCFRSNLLLCCSKNRYQRLAEKHNEQSIYSKIGSTPPFYCWYTKSMRWMVSDEPTLNAAAEDVGYSSGRLVTVGLGWDAPSDATVWQVLGEGGWVVQPNVTITHLTRHEVQEAGGGIAFSVASSSRRGRRTAAAAAAAASASPSSSAPPPPPSTTAATLIAAEGAQVVCNAACSGCTHVKPGQVGVVADTMLEVPGRVYVKWGAG